MTMGPEDNAFAAEVSADFEQPLEVLEASCSDEVVSIGAILATHNILGGTVSLAQFSKLYDFPGLAERLGLKPDELKKAIDMSTSRHIRDYYADQA